MYRKTALLLAAAMLVSLLAACGGTPAATTTAATTAAAGATTAAAAAGATTAAAAAGATTAAAAAGATTAAAAAGADEAATTTAADGTSASPATATGQEEVEIDFWHIYPADAAAEHMTGMIAKFNESYPHVKVTELGLPFFDYLEKLAPALAAGTASDLMIGDLGNPKGRAANGTIMNIQSFVDAANVDMGLFFPATVEQCTYEGELYGMPFITDTRVLFWNKKHFEEAGLDPEVPPTTWDEVIELNEKLTVMRDDGSVERMGFSTRIGNFYEWTLGWTYGAKLWNDDLTPNVDSPEMLTALNTAITIQEQVGLSAFDGFNESSKSLGFSPFIAETLSMVVETNSFLDTINEYNPELSYGVALLPTNDGVNNKASWGNGFDLEISDKGDPARAQAAFDLANFLCLTENATSFLINQSAYVCNMSAYDDESIASDPYWAVMAESGQYTRFRDYVPEYPSWYTSLTPEWEAALTGIKTPEQALADAQTRIIEEMENYRLTNG